MDGMIRSAENRRSVLLLLLTAALGAVFFIGSYLLHVYEQRSACISAVGDKLAIAGRLSEMTDLSAEEISDILLTEQDGKSIAAGEKIMNRYGLFYGSVIGGESYAAPHLLSDIWTLLGVLCAGTSGFLALCRVFSEIRSMTAGLEKNEPETDSEQRDIVLLCSAAAALCEQNAHLLRNIRAEKEYLADYLYDFSHQIKTPCTGLVLNNDILMNNPMSFEQQQEYFDNNKLCLDRISLLCASSLRLARLDAGVIEYDRSMNDLDLIVEEAMGAVRVLASENGTALENKVPPGHRVLCDRMWLCEAVTNIIKNAVEHTPGGTVRASCTADPVMIKLVITDNGSGIAEDELPLVFRRFYSKSAAHDPHSVGIGMSIAKKVIEDMHGKIYISSTKGEGTEMTIEFFQAVT
ncbi:MAG: HAMP domain-containing histidine kinase [Ruminococcus sp.]|nr:HAMP domain-containing histidine kinase [Ruminococcus sp.]